MRFSSDASVLLHYYLCFIASFFRAGGEENREGRVASSINKLRQLIRRGTEYDGCRKATHPAFQYQPISEPSESGNGGLVRWVSGRPGEAPAYAGTDFIIARDSRIAVVYLLFDKLI
jgi:hypothetical protein